MSCRHVEQEHQILSDALTLQTSQRAQPQHHFKAENDQALQILQRNQPPKMNLNSGTALTAGSDWSSYSSSHNNRAAPLVLDASSSSSVTTPSSVPPSSSSGFLRSIWREKYTPSTNLQALYPPGNAPSTTSSVCVPIVDESHIASTPQPCIEFSNVQMNGNINTDRLFLRAKSTVTPIISASALAHDSASAQKAGFLHKRGQNVPLWKRRFFVLEKPRAHLYYFLSQMDTSPRGILDIEGAEVYVIDNVDMDDEETANGESWRLELFWPENTKSVQLEAKSKELRDEWVLALQSTQFGTLQQQFRQSCHQLSASRSRIRELERQVTNYKLLEQEMQASQIEAGDYKIKFEQLDKALLALQLQYRRKTIQVDIEHQSTESSSKLVPRSDSCAADIFSVDGEPAQNTGLQSPVSSTFNVDVNERACENDNFDAKDLSSLTNKASSLSDTLNNEDDLIHTSSVPGDHFDGLYITMNELHRILNLSQKEAKQAVDDCIQAQSKVDVLEKRMDKAERHLGKLWEENCQLRKNMKQKKRERQVLVKEVKSLREAAARGNSDDTKNSIMPPACTLDEELLLNELEVNVISSLQLYEQLLRNPSAQYSVLDTSIEADAIPSISDTVAKTINPQNSSKPIGSQSDSVATTASVTSTSAATASTNRCDQGPPIASLLDDRSESEDDDDDDELSNSPTFSSVNVEASIVANHQSINTSVVRSGGSFIRVDRRSPIGCLLYSASTPSSASNSPIRPNPLLHLDESISVPNEAEFKVPFVTTNGEATSRLHCPLADVGQSKKKDENGTNRTANQLRDDDEQRVYHLTFSVKKIGLQFQKVPPPPAKPAGLLTAALTAEKQNSSNSKGNETSLGLRNIPSISSKAKAGIRSHENDFVPLATPIDAVIVCGFDGFDDTGTNIRPMRGARLVAFDGVSVEVGKWTFDSIRKSIQARGRPLTLSFRNDYLTKEQRAILTMALTGSDTYLQETKSRVHYQIPLLRRLSLDPSVSSGLSHESSNFINGVAASRTSQDDDVSGKSVSSDSDPSRNSFPQSFSGARSVTSSGRRRSGMLRSFSDTDSSVSLISSVAPLVSSLLYRTNKEPFTPDYLLRKSAPVEDTPQHQDFQSELL